MPGMTGEQIRQRLAASRLYLCTGARADRGDLAEFAEAALSGGVDVIQLRDKAAGVPIEAKQEIEALEILAKACARHGALLAVNDRADLAVAVDADVLHLGQDDIPVPLARRILGEGPAIGRSTHSAEQARAGASEPGVDYFCTGPCWPTPTKPGRHAPGLELVRETAASGTARPWFAIGGIDLGRLPEVFDAGASRVVVVRAITEAEDPASAARAIRSRLPA
ncbi:thiamine phosphate synthase [Amycolatopsis antarctica]|uniref:Thiamine-phosphate synthase n=1 Tax=Amycolatopsis antarctica TaxID=1854586 RepID=A0A263CYQ4_9PSEU|nr:thiamine phosphate synthase [Amycolatopsis antarctica]OZM71038.1 thiamine phosphate synthase [Amycolatopsis antarctica]